MITRRQALNNLAIGVTYIALSPSLLTAASTSEKRYQFRWTVPVAHLETIEKELIYKGDYQQQKDIKGVPLVYILVGVVLLPDLVKAVFALHREMKHGGVTIDTRGEEIIIATDKSLPGGVIIVVDPKGTELYELDNMPSPGELIEILKLKPM